MNRTPHDPARLEALEDARETFRREDLCLDTVCAFSIDKDGNRTTLVAGGYSDLATAKTCLAHRNKGGKWITGPDGDVWSEDRRTVIRSHKRHFQSVTTRNADGVLTTRHTPPPFVRPTSQQQAA